MTTAAAPREQGALAEAASAFFSISRFHILCIASITALCFGWQLTDRWLWLAPALCTFDWFLVNLMNRVADLVEDRINQAPGTAFADRHSGLLTWGSVALLVGSFPVTHLLWPQLTPWRLAFQAIGIAYNYKVIPTRQGLTRFKETYFWKNSSSAVLFLISTLAYPVLLAGAPVEMVKVAWLAAFFFPLELTYEVIYDLRDLDGDRAGNVPTYPVVHGLGTAHSIVEGLLALSAVLLVAGYASGALGFRELLMLAGVAQQALFFELRVKRKVTQADCIFLTYLGAAQVASYLVWIGLGLPVVPPGWR